MTQGSFIVYAMSVLNLRNSSLDIVFNDTDDTIIKCFIVSENGDRLLRLDKYFEDVSEVYSFFQKMIKTSNVMDLSVFTFVESPDSIKIYNSIFKNKY